MVRRRSNLGSVPTFSSKEKEIAWRAIAKFNELKPQLTAFARSITGRKNVEIHATSQGPYTQGNKIFLRPPMALGRNYSHERNLCGSRGDDGRQSCAACRAREVVNFYLFHEIGHIWLGTQDEVTWEDRELADKHIDEWHPDLACNHAGPIRSLVYEMTEAMGIANSVNPYLGGFVNALEDARINEGMFDARPGLRQIFDVNIERLMSEGVEHNLGEMKLWKDAPADAQFSVALSIRAYGYDIEEWFHPDVVKAISDERIQAICDASRAADSVHDILRLGLEAFTVAQELGFCLIPKCEVPPPSDPNPEESDPEDRDEEDDGLKDAEGAEGGAPSASGTGGSDLGASEAGTDSDGMDPGSSPASDSDQDGSGHDKGSTPGTDGESTSPGSSSDGVADDGKPESGRSSGRSPEEDVTESDPSDPASGQGDDREDEFAGSPDESEEHDGQAGDSGGQSEDEGESSVPHSGQERVGEPSGDSEDDATAGSATSDEDVSNDGSPQNGNVAERSDEDHDSESAGEESLPDLDDDADPAGPTDPWEIKSPDSDGPVDVGAHTPLPAAGDPQDIGEAMAPFLMHGMQELAGMIEDMLGEDMSDILDDIEDGNPEFDRTTTLIAIALSQVLFFDDPSMTVAGVDVAKFPAPEIRWRRNGDWKNFMPTETLLGQAVMHARRVFEDNRRTHLEPNKKSGKIRAKVLGRRAPVGDERIFGHKTVPKRKSYLVIIAGDCSASTNSYNRNEKIKRMMFAQAEILHRVGVPFAMLGHSASDVKIKDFRKDGHGDYWMYVLPIKEEHEQWTDVQRERLAGMNPVSENLDGHALQYCRKIADRSTATDVIIIYYTDGEMPASNGTEEKAILMAEIALCKKKKYHTLAVGIETDSPVRYGMKTVRADSDDDIKLVIKQLEEELTHI